MAPFFYIISFLPLFVLSLTRAKANNLSKLPDNLLAK